MPNERSPAFRFYVRDFATDTVHMTDAQVGLYVRLLSREWMDGSIPAAFDGDGETILGLLPAGSKKERAADWRVVSRCFMADPTDPTRLIQKRLEAERAKQKDNRDRRSAAGRKGADARWSDGKRIATAQPTQSDGSAEVVAKNGLAFAFAFASAETRFAGAHTGETLNPFAPEPIANIDVYSPGVQFAAWFGREGCRRGAIGAHEVTSLLQYALRHEQPATALASTHSPEELVQQAVRMFDRALVDGPDRQRVVTLEMLQRYWSRFDPPRAAKPAPADGEDLDAYTRPQAVAS